MQIKTSREKLFRYLIILVVFIILLVLVLIFLPYYHNKRLSYEKLLEHCVESSQDVRECKVFLKDYKEEDGETCLEIVLPKIDPLERDIEICSSSRVEWDNPYDDYSLLIPVVLKMYYEKTSLIPFNPSSFTISLMEDGETYDVLEPIYSSETEPITNVRTKFIDEGISRGYYFFAEGVSGEPEFFVGLTNVDILFVSKEEGLVKMRIKFVMDDQEIQYEITEKDFEYHNSLKREIEVVSVSNVDDYINTENPYSFRFAIYDNKTKEGVKDLSENISNEIKKFFQNESTSIYLKFDGIEQ